MPTEIKRKKVLLLTEKEWKDLNDRRDFMEKEQEVVDKYRRDRLRLKEESKEMVKHWRNTLEDTRAKQLKMRQERLDKEHAARELKFLEIEKEKAEERRKYLEQCKKILSYERDNTKTLHSALRFAEIEPLTQENAQLRSRVKALENRVTELKQYSRRNTLEIQGDPECRNENVLETVKQVLREREAQIKFEKKLQDIEMKREAEYAAKIKKDAEDYEQEKIEEARKAEKKKKETSRIFRKHLKKQEKYRKLEKELLLDERKQMEGLQEEIDMLEKQGKEREKAKKAHFREGFFQSLKEKKELQERMKEREAIDDETAAVYTELKRKLAKIRKEKVKQKREKEQVIKERIAARIMKVTGEKEQQEEASIKRAIAERDEKERQMKEKREAYQKRLREDTIQGHHKYLEEEEKRKQRDKEIMKWEILQRFKRAEEDMKLEIDDKEKYRKLQRYMKRCYEKQVLEREAREREEVEEDINAAQDAKNRWAAQDQEFLKYAEEIIEESKKLNRPVEPIVKVVEEYKIQVGLTKVKRNMERFRSRIPFGLKGFDEAIDLCGPCKCEDGKK